MSDRGLKNEAGSEVGTDFGGLLRRARESRGIPLLDVSQRTRVRLHYLEMIEGNRVEDLPAEVFVRGFVRAYARAVGADEKEASQMLSARLSERRSELQMLGETGVRGATRGLRAHPRTVILISALVAVLAVIALLLFR